MSIGCPNRRQKKITAQNAGVMKSADSLTLFHLSAHVVNCLLRENQKTIPKILSDKNATLQILNFIPDKKFPHMV